MKICLSNLIKRNNHVKATMTVNKVYRELSTLQLSIPDNANIDVCGLLKWFYLFFWKTIRLNLCKAISKQQKISSASNFSNETNFDKFDVARSSNVNQILIAYIKIDSFTNKFEMFMETIKTKIDVILVSETKLDSSFTLYQFLIDSFASPQSFHRNQNDRVIMLYIREHIHAKYLT